MSIYNIKVTNNEGKEVNLEIYRGKVLLIVNTATGCGFTPQYAGLQKLYDTYKEKGFEVLDFPCNQFGNQAPGTNEEINSFCTLNYNASFPRFNKIDVNGEKESPLYTLLKSRKKGIMNTKIKWNFTKFLVDKSGNIVDRYSPTTTPEKIEEDIKKLLK